MNMNEYKVQWEKARKQKKLEDRYNKKDPAIDFCNCGNYFKKVYFNGTSMTPTYRNCCKECFK